MTTKLAIPYLKESAKKGRNPHVLVMSPPPDLRPLWFERHVGYTMAKYAMSLAVLGLSPELAEYGIAVNALWPLTAIETSAMKNVIDKEGRILFYSKSRFRVNANIFDTGLSKNRTPDILADAAKCILLQPASEYTGNFVIDEVILRYQGVTDFSRYRVDPNCKDSDLQLDFFLPENPFENAVVPPLQVLKFNAKL